MFWQIMFFFFLLVCCNLSSFDLHHSWQRLSKRHPVRSAATPRKNCRKCVFFSNLGVDLKFKENKSNVLFSEPRLTLKCLLVNNGFVIVFFSFLSDFYKGLTSNEKDHIMTSLYLFLLIYILGITIGKSRFHIYNLHSLKNFSKTN